MGLITSILIFCFGVLVGVIIPIILPIVQIFQNQISNQIGRTQLNLTKQSIKLQEESVELQKKEAKQRPRFRLRYRDRKITVENITDYVALEVNVTANYVNPPKTFKDKNSNIDRLEHFKEQIPKQFNGDYAAKESKSYRQEPHDLIWELEEKKAFSITFKNIDGEEFTDVLKLVRN